MGRDSGQVWETMGRAPPMCFRGNRRPSKGSFKMAESPGKACDLLHYATKQGHGGFGIGRAGRGPRCPSTVA